MAYAMGVALWFSFKCPDILGTIRVLSLSLRYQKGPRGALRAGQPYRSGNALG